MQVDYSLIQWPPENGVRIGLGVSEVPLEPGIGHAPVERVSFGSNEYISYPREVYLTHFSDGVKGITSTSDLSGKLRVVRAGTTLSGYYYGNGSWVLVHSAPVTAADLYIVLAAWSGNSMFADQEVKIAFDNFVIKQGDLNCEPVPTPTPTCTVTSYDDFNDNAINPCLWAVYYEGSGLTINETNQRLEIVLPADSTGDLSSGRIIAKYFSVCRLTGNFDMQVEYQLIDWPSENGVRVGLGVEVAPTTHERGYPVERVSFGVDDFIGWPREVYLTHFSDGVRGITNTSDLSGKMAAGSLYIQGLGQLPMCVSYSLRGAKTNSLRIRRSG